SVEQPLSTKGVERMRIESRSWTHSHTKENSQGRERFRPEKYLLLPALLTCLLAICGCEEQASSATAKPVEAPVSVQAVHTHRGEIYRYVNLPGEVRPLYEVTLFAKVDGYLDKLMVDKGDSVKAGGLIADIDVPELRANLAKYKAELELAQAELKQ